MKPAPWNPREIDDVSKAALKNSLAEFGDVAGITWSTRGYLVTGHQRVSALKEKYGKSLRVEPGNSPDACYLKTPDGHSFHVRIVDWDEKTEKAANVAANSPFLAGEFAPSLKDILESLEDDGDFFAKLRFDELEMAEIRNLGFSDGAGKPAEGGDRGGDGGFAEIPDIEPKYKCPRCGYEWKGKPK